MGDPWMVNDRRRRGSEDMRGSVGWMATAGRFS